MQTVKTLIIGLFIYGLSNIGISAKSLADLFTSDDISLNQFSAPTLGGSTQPPVVLTPGSTPNTNIPSNQFGTPTLDSHPPVVIPDTELHTDALSIAASEAFVSDMFKDRDVYMIFLKHLQVSLSFNDNFKAINDFLNIKCRNKCDIKSIFAVLDKFRSESLFFWVGKYRTNLKFNKKGQTFTLFITNGAKVENNKVVDGSVFINDTPIYNAIFKDKQLTWGYDTDSMQPNTSKGNINFFDIFLENSFIGHNFFGTLVVDNKITGEENIYKFTGFSRVRTPSKLSIKGRGGLKNGTESHSNTGANSKNSSGDGSGNDSGDDSENTLSNASFDINDYYPEPMGVGLVNYKADLFGSQVWTVENMHHFPSKHMKDIFFTEGGEKYYKWAAAMNSETKEGAKGMCAPGWRIPTDSDWKKLEGYLHMSKTQQDKNNAYRGKDQASLLHQGRFNAELLGFFGTDNHLLKQGSEAHFISSSKSTTPSDHFIGRKITTVPASDVRFILIKQTTFGKMAIGNVKVMSKGQNIVLNKTALAYEAGVDSDKIAESNTLKDNTGGSIQVTGDTTKSLPFMPSTPTSVPNIVNNPDLGFLSKKNSDKVGIESNTPKDNAGDLTQVTGDTTKSLPFMPSTPTSVPNIVNNPDLGFLSKKNSDKVGIESNTPKDNAGDLTQVTGDTTKSLPFMPSTPTSIPNIVNNSDLGFLSKKYSDKGWIIIDLGAKYKIDRISITELLYKFKRVSAAGLAVFTSSEKISTKKPLAELRVDPNVSSMGISIRRPLGEYIHNFDIDKITLDLWRGDISNDNGSSVRCIQNDTAPALTVTSAENIIQIGKPLELPITILNFAPGLINSWSIHPVLDNGLVFDTKTGLISGTPNKLQSRVRYDIAATNDKGTSTATIYITIVPILVNNIEVSGKNVLKIGETVQLSATISPSDATNKNLLWLADENVKIDSKTGKVTGLKEGISSIRAVSSNGFVVGRFEVLVVDSQTVVANKKPYKIILSETTGKIWLDRNLGAFQACKTTQDKSCYGNLYQWGRGNDGHQSRGHVRKTAILANSITPSSNGFIVSGNSNSEDDWTASDVDESGKKRAAAWSKSDNNICPVGFRVPTSKELISAATDASLKFSLSGNRNVKGRIENLGKKGFYWSRNLTTNSFPRKRLSDGFEFNSNDNFAIIAKERMQGFSVRCINDTESGTPIIIPSVNQLSTRIGETFTPITFTNFGPAATQWSIRPIPSNGLSFDRNTGTISGRPKKVMPETYYTVAATNSFGANTALVRITVNSVAVPVTNIQLSHNTSQIKGRNILEVGETITLSAAITPSNATIQDLLWKVKSNYATISGTQSGATLTGVSAGVADIYATSLDGEYVVAKLTVHIIDKVFQGKIYNTVVSPKTKRVWLDRNTGADQVCASNNEVECYGNLYQFGRASDGHQLRINGTFKKEQAKTITPNEVTFFTNTDQSKNLANDPVDDDRGWVEQTWDSFSDWITGSSDSHALKSIIQQEYDWTKADKKSVDRVKFWSNNTVTSDEARVCPVGFEVPSIDEISAEMGYFPTSGRATALKSFLKLPAAGSRQFHDGNLKNEGIEGRYWSKTPVGAHHTKNLVFSPARMDVYRGIDKSPRSSINKDPIFPDSRYTDTNKPLREHTANANGYSVRCIKSEAKMVAGGIKYKTVKIGSQRWTAETMRHGNGRKDSSSYYAGVDDVKAGLTGKLYRYSVAMNNSTKENAQGICASGWHIPSRKDWTILKEYMDSSHNKTAATLFLTPLFTNTTNYVTLSKKLHSILADVYINLWTSNKSTSSGHSIDEAQVRCIEDEEVMEIEGTKYRTVRIGAQVWTSENMRHRANADEITASDGSFSLYKRSNKGRLYTWSEAMKGSTIEGAQGICASGWHIPTTQDWKTLEMYLGMSATESNKNMAWRGTNQGTQLKKAGDSGFEAIMTGVMRGGVLSVFNDSVKQTYFWSSRQKISDHSMAWKLALDLSKPKVFYGTTYETDAASVRCIKNNEVMKAGGINYNSVIIGGQVWTSENMRHGTNSAENGVYSYKDKISNDKLYGKSYTWSAAMKGSIKEGAQGICAENWRIPTERDWKNLEKYLGMDAEAMDSENAWRGTNQGTKLKKGGIGFNADLKEGKNPFGDTALVTSMWTSTSFPESSMARSRTLESTKDQIYSGANSKDTALSVRCIKQQTMVGINLALHKTATQSSMDLLAKKAVDGSTDGNFFGGSTTHTSSERNPWWMVDLGQEYPIDKINIFNRTDCCKDRLSNYRVIISNDPSLNKASYVKDFHSYPNPKKTIDVSMYHLRGRYVRIELLGESEQVLSLAEVQVIMQEDVFTAAINAKNQVLNAKNISLKKPTKQSSTDLTTTSKLVVDGNTDGNYDNHSVSRTREEPQDTWWTVDLQGDYHITKINIFNRTDCCKNRLRNYRVTIANDANFSDIKYIKEFHVAPDPKVTIDLSEYDIEGRHVKIEALKLPGRKSILSLAEVQVMGIEAPH